MIEVSRMKPLRVVPGRIVRASFAAAFGTSRRGGEMLVLTNAGRRPLQFTWSGFLSLLGYYSGPDSATRRPHREFLTARICL